MQLSRVLSAIACSNCSRVTPRFNPTNRCASAVECAMYQFSVFGSPLSSPATYAGGCTCRLSRSRQSSHFTKIGNGRSAGHFGPITSEARVAISERSVMPL